MEIIVITLFPELVDAFFSASLVGKAVKNGLVRYRLINPREFALPPHHHVDDSPYGGGPGMVMKPEPMTAAIEKAREYLPDAHVLLMSASGTIFDQNVAKATSTLDQIILVCCRYEGLDQRVIDLVIDEEICIGNYVTMGGEVPAMVLIESILRLKPDVIGNSESVYHESFSIAFNNSTLLECPQYTRPEVFRGLKVPQVLLSGDHKKIEDWRLQQSFNKTKAKRPDLLKGDQKNGG